MANAIFDFCPNSHVAVEQSPEEPKVTSFNGWTFTSKPAVPFAPSYRLKLGGLRWYLTGSALNTTTNPTLNAGRLRQFYITHRLFEVFTYPHEFLGNIDCRFAEPVNIPEAIINSGGLCPEFEVVIIRHNPGY